jgi:hypothetical protein
VSPDSAGAPLTPVPGAGTWEPVKWGDPRRSATCLHNPPHVA